MINSYTKDSVGICYKNGNLFEGSTKGSILTHACNCKGSMASGIALSFKQLFPESYKTYNSYCKTYKDFLGSTLICTEENSYRMACMFTSSGFGSTLDSKEDILKNTEESFKDLLSQVYLNGLMDTEINLCKINSGLFKVPWEETEKVLLKVLEDYKNLGRLYYNINVWSL